MLDIYICEDNRKQLDLFTEYINDTILIESLDMQVVLGTSDPNEVLKKVEGSQNMGIFFLDIDLKSTMNGLTLAQKIRKIQQKYSLAAILYLSHHIPRWDF